jgi:hypothetical protein
LSSRFSRLSLFFSSLFFLFILCACVCQRLGVCRAALDKHHRRETEREKREATTQRSLLNPTRLPFLSLSLSLSFRGGTTGERALNTGESERLFFHLVLLSGFLKSAPHAALPLSRVTKSVCRPPVKSQRRAGLSSFPTHLCVFSLSLSLRGLFSLSLLTASFNLQTE